MRQMVILLFFVQCLISCALVCAQETRRILLLPTGVTVDSSGNVFIADAKGYRILKQGLPFAGDGFPCQDPTAGCGDGGLAVGAQLNLPTAVAISSNGDVYIADSKDNRIRRVDHFTDHISTVAGTGVRGFGGDGGPATSALLNRPCGVSTDSLGNLYIADTDNNRIREVDSNGTINTIF